MMSFFDRLLVPFRRYFSLLVLLVGLSSVFDIYYYGWIRQGIGGGIIIAGCNFVEVYLLILLGSLFPYKWGRWWYWGVLPVGVFMFFLMDLFAMCKLHRCFDEDILGIVLGTNWGEAGEFLCAALEVPVVTAVLAFPLLTFVAYWGFRRRSMMPRGLAVVLLCGIPVAGGLWLRQPELLGQSLLGKMRTVASVPRPVDLQAYYGHDEVLVETVGPGCAQVVVIIGESFAKKHSSLYGYERCTNPELEVLRDQGNLFVYDDVESVAVHTVPSFKGFMSLYRNGVGQEQEWYEYVSLPELINKGGYASLWISNQSPSGFYDNVPASYAKLCDEVVFVGDLYSGVRKTDKDACVLEALSSFTFSDSVPRVTFVHLMGSHPNFRDRYPVDFERFTAADYMEFPECQRQTLAEYDNSVLYNDSVVAQIMGHFADKAAIVLYFSDHGLDLYESSPDYCSHANVEDPKSLKAGQQIPFMVYLSPVCRERFPELEGWFERRLHQPYVVEDLPYMVMRLMGKKVVQRGAPG